jgi:hypothetical protein
MIQKSAVPFKQPSWYTNMRPKASAGTAKPAAADPNTRIDNILTGLRKRGIVIEGEFVSDAQKSVDHV